MKCKLIQNKTKLIQT